eukprot:7300225-Pyramimonas_sp.AAC.1
MESDYNRRLGYIELGFNVIFTVESLLLAVAKCFMLGPHPYLLSGWNKLDFVVVIFSWLVFIPGLENLSFLRAMRVIKVRHPGFGASSTWSGD